MQQVIIDTDPGVDDALAIAFAARSKLSIVGLVTVFGNSTVKNSTANAQTVLNLLKSKIPIIQGARKPLFGSGTYARSHGKDGLGGFRLTPGKETIPKINEITFLINLLNKTEYKEIIYVCIGPATNLAILNIIRPDLMKKIKEIVILGGVIGEKGNITQYAEFNVFNDPYAFREVLAITCRKVVIPINICRQVVVSADELNRISNKSLRSSFAKIAEVYIDYYSTKNKFGTFSGGVMYDLLAVAYVLEPSLFKLRKEYVSIDCISDDKIGLTRIVKNTKSNCNLVIQANAEKVKQLFFRTINKLK